MFKIEKFNKFYNKGKKNQLHVTDDVSIEFASKGLVCILGESGCGKTTLVNEIGGLDSYDSGRMVINDQVIQKYNQSKIDKIRTQKYSYVFQNYFLLQDRTIQYNIELILNMYKLSDDEKKKRIDYVLKAVDLEKYNNRIVSQLSGGQQQRVAIARALAKSPSVIFADEPTGNLDELNTLKIISILKKISENCLVIIVTHDKRIADCFADRIISMKDGKIVGEVVENKQDNEYKFIDSSKIYLKELTEEKIEQNNIDFNIYNNNKLEKTKLNIVYENEKVYVSSNDEKQDNIVFLTKDMGVKMVDENIPVLHINDFNNIDYNLDKIDDGKIPKLHIKDLLKFTFTNYKSMGKKRIIVAISFFIISVLLSIFTADWITMHQLDYKSYVNTDSHIINLEISKASAVSDTSLNSIQNEIFTSIKQKYDKTEIYPQAEKQIKFLYEGFFQVEGQPYTTDNFCIVNIDKLKKDKIIYGNYPKDMTEIVLDKWVADNLISESNLKDIIFDYKSLLGKSIQVDSKNPINQFTIVGICDSGFPNIYLDKNAIFMVSKGKNNIIPLSEFNKITEGKFSKIKLNKNEVAVNKTDSGHIDYVHIEMKLENDYTSNYLIKTDFSYDKFGGLAVIDDKYIDDYEQNVLLGTHKLSIYCDNANQLYKFLNDDIKSKYDRTVDIIVEYPYKDQMDLLEKERSLNIDTRDIIAISIFIVSIIISYFVIKSSVSKNIKDISVFRLLGISKLSIATSFALQISIITTYTSLIGCILTGVVINFISNIKSINVNLSFPWYMVVLTILLLYIINIVISIIPVMSILKLPPAKLAAKCDM